MNAKCPICGDGELKSMTGLYETQYSGRDGVARTLQVPDVNWLECANCGEAILDASALAKIENERLRAQGLLTPAQIRDLREKLEKSQAEMSSLLGIGKKTYCRWESGAYTQSFAFDRYLRLLIEEPKNIAVLQRLETSDPGVTAEVANERPSNIFPELIEETQLIEMAELFTDLMTRGELQTADEPVAA